MKYWIIAQSRDGYRGGLLDINPVAATNWNKSALWQTRGINQSGQGGVPYSIYCSSRPFQIFFYISKVEQICIGKFMAKVN